MLTLEQMHGLFNLLLRRSNLRRRMQRSETALGGQNNRLLELEEWQAEMTNNFKDFKKENKKELDQIHETHFEL